MRECRTYGSVRGVWSNPHPYRDSLGCPHEEGVDYPEGQICPQCPFWAHRDRWTGEVM